MYTLILCNGLPPEKALFEKYLRISDLFIAADGGGNTARDLGHLPDVVVGDLDSFQEQPDDTLEIIRDSDQESNDLEKALALAAERGSSDVVVLGVTGQRIDQTLKNISVLKRFDRQFSTLTFEDNFGRLMLLPKNYTADLEIGTTVSLFPLSGKVDGISTSGLKYTLNNESLENGVRDGSSNMVVNSPVEIRYRSGDLLLFVAHSHAE